MTAAPVNHYDQGDLVRCSVTIRNVSGALENPSALEFKWKNAAGQVVDTKAIGQLQTPSTGVFYFDVPIPVAAASAGEWFTRYTATGSLVGAVEGKFIVKASAF